MTQLNELNPNELFRFLNVRGPQKQSGRPSNHAFAPLVYDTLTEKQMTVIAKDHRLLYPELNALNGNPDQLSASLKLVTAYKAGNEFISSPDAYLKNYPALTTFIDWLDVNADVATLKELQDKFQTIHQQTIDAYAATHEFVAAKVIIWDNLFANLFSATDAFLVTLACKYLGTLNLIYVLSTDDKPSSAPGTIYRSRPLVPKWFFGLSVKVDRKPDEGVNDQSRALDTTHDELKTKFKIAVSVSNELQLLFEKSKKRAADRQASENKKARTPVVVAHEGAVRTTEKGAVDQPSLQGVPNPLAIGSDDLKTLSADALSLMGSLLGASDAYDLQHVLHLVHGYASELGSKIGAWSLRTAVKVGGSIVDSADFCADMLDRDPCGRAPRKDFVSNGSYVASSLIGDLLVTKQQLIKYDLGEVAHVESVMVGLDKERTHRRLNRSETTDLIETETTTENERETQTTDRFDMEKESSKALTQDFQIDAGVNASGSYGTVNFSSTLDTSFGTSSQQTQSEATSFSKTVTTRALSRIKERVRQQKTVTIINETEETSVNKLKNDTGDNVNGVYRWLDKYYLNKIINYGKRLMFEFTVPEPAQFYVFRQIAKPKADNTVEKPENPKTATDPLGHSLNSPANISESNYTFWAALYGATNVAAPPPAFVKVSKSWKNESDTSQGGNVFESASKAFEVENGYEAIHEDVACQTVDWDGNAGITGTIATSWFGWGASSISLVPSSITKEVGVAIYVRGMLWTLSVTLTEQRSAKLFADWQIDSYNKIIDAYNAKERDFQTWVESQSDTLGQPFTVGGNNPDINRDTEREEVKKRCLELFTGQRFESFDAAVNGIYNRSAYPEILFAESIREGNIVKFFEQAFDWANMTYIFYPYMWGRKSNWLSAKLVEDPSDPLFTKFLQAGYARAVAPVRPGFENYLLIFHLMAGLASDFGCGWNFQPSIFGALGISNTFSPGVNDPTYMSIAQEIQSAAGYTDEAGPIYGTPYVQKVPTSLVYVAQNSHVPNTPWPGLPDNSADPDIAPYL